MHTELPDSQIKTWIESLNSPFDQKLGLTITHACPEQVCGWAPVSGNTQIYGAWHGGASAGMIETLGSLAANLFALENSTSESTKLAAVGIELNCSHHRRVTAGRVFGQATAVKLGKTIVCYQITLSNEKSELVASGRLTCAIVATPTPHQPTK